MKRVMMMALTTTAMTLAACGSKTTTTNSDQTVVTNSADAINGSDMADNAAAAATPAAPGQEFADAAAKSDAFEIATSKLAETAAGAAKIKTYAASMIEAHNASTAKLKSVAGGLSPAVTPDPTLTPDQQAKLDALKGKTGKDFDTAYAAAQVEAHQATLAKLKDYGANGDVPALKTLATGLAPTVTAHLDMAKAL